MSKNFKTVKLANCQTDSTCELLLRLENWQKTLLPLMFEIPRHRKDAFLPTYRTCQQIAAGASRAAARRTASTSTNHSDRQTPAAATESAPKQIQRIISD